MSKQSYVRRHWKVILNIVTIVALIILVYVIRDQLATTIRDLARVNAWALILIIPIEILNYHAQTRMYQNLFLIVGNKLRYRDMYEASLELNFVNHVFPSGGVTGLSYFGVRLSAAAEISAAKATLIQVMKLAMTFLSFELLLIIGLIFLAVGGHVSNVTILFAGVMSTLIIVMTVVFAYVVGSKSRINSFFTSLTRALNWLIHLVFRHNKETININIAKTVFNDFHDNYQTLVSHRKELRAPFWYAFMANLTEVLAIYVVYLAFGKDVNIGAIIIAYGVANFAGLFSVLPGGIGIYEAIMTAVLAATGIPPSVSLPVTIMYRVVNTAIQLPPGYYFYHRALGSGHTSIKSTKVEK
jgi:uncharacterized protein (TIRG00374 family)